MRRRKQINLSVTRDLKNFLCIARVADSRIVDEALRHIGRTSPFFAEAPPATSKRWRTATNWPVEKWAYIALTSWRMKVFKLSIIQQRTIYVGKLINLTEKVNGNSDAVQAISPYSLLDGMSG
jgi:hypothetical protein